ncbi:MAG TPA: redoxin family protein [Planctomycetota bacterium]|jgi:peroxiredoxin|nr:redoxin family protein [Planctomycetota bacterium]
MIDLHVSTRAGALAALLSSVLLAVAPAPDTRLDSAELGKPAPLFELKNLDGKTVNLSDSKGKLIVLEWLNPACPFCQYAYGPTGPLRTYPEAVRSRGVAWFTIVSENPGNPGGKPDAVRKFVEQNHVKTTVLLDTDGKVGKAYGAKSTPQLFLISEKGALVYRGALDNAPQGIVEKNDARTNYIAAALADLATGHAVLQSETKPYGTSIGYLKR